MRIFLSLLLLLFICSNAYGADLSADVCEGAAVCDYTTLNGAATGEDQDLTDSGGDSFTIEIKNAWTAKDTSRTTMAAAGWVQDATYYLTIKTEGAARHSGVWLATGHILYNASYGTHITLSSYTRWDGVQVEENIDYETEFMRMAANSTGIHVKNSIFKQTDANSKGRGIDWENGLTDCYVYNNLFYDMNQGMYSAYGNAPLYIYNNTFVDNTVGINAMDTALLKNNLAIDNGTDYVTNDTWHASNATNMSDDATSPNVAGRDAVVVFSNQAGDNYQLVAGDDAEDFGTDLSAEIDSNDFKGTARGATWDVGADEIATVAGRTRRFFML